jgi:hypothetical protein
MQEITRSRWQAGEHRVGSQAWYMPESNLGRTYGKATIDDGFLCAVHSSWRLLFGGYLLGLLSLNLNMQAIRAPETLVDFCRTTRRHIPEQSVLYYFRRLSADILVLHVYIILSWDELVTCNSSFYIDTNSVYATCLRSRSWFPRCSIPNVTDRHF